MKSGRVEPAARDDFHYLG